MSLAPFQRLVVVSAKHFGVAVAGSSLDSQSQAFSQRLAAACSSLSAATTAKPSLMSRTQRRRKFRQQHKDRVGAATFIIEMQLRGLRGQLAELEQWRQQSTMIPRDKMLSMSPPKVKCQTDAPDAVFTQTQQDALLGCATDSIRAVTELVATAPRPDND